MSRTKPWPWTKFLPPELKIILTVVQTHPGVLDDSDDAAVPGSLAFLLAEDLEEFSERSGGEQWAVWETATRRTRAEVAEYVYPRTAGLVWIDWGDPSHWPRHFLHYTATGVSENVRDH